MPDKIFGGDRPPGLFPKRKFKDHGDGSYSERVIAETDSGEPATQATLAAILAQLDITLSVLRDALRGTSTKDFTTVEADVEASKAVLDNIKAKTDNLDLAITALRDALRGASNKDFTTLETDLEAVLAKLDVALSTRAIESGGNLQTLAGKDFATQTTLAAVLGQLDITLSSLRDAICAAAPNNKTLNDLDSRLNGIDGKLNAITEYKAAYGSSTGAGLTVELDAGMWQVRQQFNIWVKSSGVATFTVQGRREGQTWHDVYDESGNKIEIALSGAGEGGRQLACGYRFIRVTTTAANDNEIEIVR